MEDQTSFKFKDADDNQVQREGLLPTCLSSSQRSLASVPSLNNSCSQQSHHNNNNNHPASSYYNCLTTLKPHTSYTSSLTLTPKFLYTASSNTEIKSWNRTSLPQQSTTLVSAARNGAVKSLVLHSNKLFTAHQDHKIRVWKITENETQHVATLPTFIDRVTKILIPKNHVEIRRHKKCTWVHHVDAVSSLALSKDGTLLYSVSWDRTIKVWRTKDFTCLESLRNAHEDAINAVAVSYDGYVYTGSTDKRIKVWKKKKGEKKHLLVDTLEKHNSGINALVLSSDGNVLYSGACDRSILVSEKGENGNLVVMGALRGHSKSILCLAVVSDLVCSGSEDKTIRIWRGVDRREYLCLVVLEGHKGPIKCLTAVFDDRCDQPSEATLLVYSSSLDCHIKVWKIFVPLLQSIEI